MPCVVAAEQCTLKKWVQGTNGKEYYISSSNENKNAIDAEKTCEQCGANLASIVSEEEYKFIQAQ